MHRENPERTEEELYDDLEFASYAFPTLDERIAMLWDRFRGSRRPKDFAELKRLLARQKAWRTRAHR